MLGYGKLLPATPTKSGGLDSAVSIPERRSTSLSQNRRNHLSAELVFLNCGRVDEESSESCRLGNTQGTHANKKMSTSESSSPVPRRFATHAIAVVNLMNLYIRSAETDLVIDEGFLKRIFTSRLDTVICLGGEQPGALPAKCCRQSDCNLS